MIKNFILDNNNEYYNLFQKIIEKRIGILFEKDEEIKNNISHCFLIKLKQFSIDKNIALNFDIALNEENNLHQDNKESLLENSNFYDKKDDDYNLPNEFEIENNYPKLGRIIKASILSF